MTTATIPDVCLADDVCRLLKISRSTLARLRAANKFPIAELERLDKHARWSGEDVRRYMDGQQRLPKSRVWARPRDEARG